MTHHPGRLSALLRSTLIVTLALAAGSAAFAQITVTNATFPAAGDTLRMAIDNSPSVINLVYTPPGFGLTWDLSGLQATETKTFIYRPAAEGLVAFRFPGAELVMTSPPSPEESYYDVTSTQFSLQAFHGTGPYDVVTSKVFVYTPPLRERAAPLNFFDVRQSSSGILAALHPSDFPPALIAALPVSPDSLRYRVAFNELQAVDAFGTLILPDGSYSVLRQKQTAYRETRLDAKIPPLGWLDITDIALQSGFAGVGVDTTVTFDFYDDTQKLPIVSVELNAAQNAAVRTLFKSALPTVVDAGSTPEFRARLGQNQPNPFNPRTTIRFDLANAGEVELTIYDVAGRRVRTLVQGTRASGRHEVVWSGVDDIGQRVASGVYLYRLRAGSYEETRRMTLLE